MEFPKLDKKLKRILCDYTYKEGLCPDTACSDCVLGDGSPTKLKLIALIDLPSSVIYEE